MVLLLLCLGPNILFKFILVACVSCNINFVLLDLTSCNKTLLSEIMRVTLKLQIYCSISWKKSPILFANALAIFDQIVMTKGS